MISFLRSIALFSLAAATAGAQATPRQLALVPDRQIEVKLPNANVRDMLLAIGPKGQIAVTARNGWGGISVFDSTGKPYPWRVKTGRSDSSEIGFPLRMSWVGQSDTMWVADASFDGQIVLIDGAGKVFKSLENPTWIHPTWAERRKFPVFGRMQLLAVNSDQTMLIVPSRPKSLLDTPGYDRSRMQVLRATWDGGIRSSVAMLPPDNRAIQFRAKGCNYTLQIPFGRTAAWDVSLDGSRVAMITMSGGTADSGAVHLTVLNERSDTVFARDLPLPVQRVDQASLDKFLGTVNTCGQLTAEQMRDSARSRFAKFTANVSGVMVGRDQSTWVLLRNPMVPTERRALILDPKGEVVGIVTLKHNENPLAVGRDYYWSFEQGKPNTPSTLVRFRVDATGKANTASTAAPPPRTAPASTSPKRSKPPE
jgi:hypothetical protein